MIRPIDRCSVDNTTNTVPDSPTLTHTQSRIHKLNLNYLKVQKNSNKLDVKLALFMITYLEWQSVRFRLALIPEAALGAAPEAAFEPSDGAYGLSRRPAARSRSESQD